MLRQRLVSAGVGIAILLLVLFLGGVRIWAAFVAIAGIAGAMEFYIMVRHSGTRPFVALGCIWTALLILSPLMGANPDRAAVLITSLGLVASFVWLLSRRQKEGSALALAWTLAGALYIGWLARYLVALRGLQDGLVWVILALFTTFATDTAAYLVGRAWGRHKMAPQVSPKKTWEGAAAGLAGALIASVVLSLLLDLPLLIWQALLLGLVIGVAAQLGDLVESMFKRGLGAKDSGRIMPGHGGILDRADSILLSGLVVYYYVILT
ncbi:MAG: phosphatidate cytidylyltransferase [Chloroflexi bacterium]|nr:phosphatidate cytidylyltransferase [Chloroflexota bacterium]